MCIAAATLAVIMQEDVDRCLGLIGAVLCSPLALTIPASLHLKVLAKTRLQKSVDCVLIVTSILVLLFSVVQNIET